MSTSDHSLLKETQKELQMVKNRYSELHKSFEKFKAQFKCSDKEVPSDPFLLDDPCVMKILSFLKPKELLESMEVCQSWKQYMKSSDLLMKRIYDGVILSINFEEKVVPDDLRPSYKHMSLYFPRTSDISTTEMQENNVNLLLNRYAPSLDTLSIYHEDFRGFMPHPLCYLTGSFPMLRKLIIRHFRHLFQILQESPFPELEVLCITAGWQEMAPMDISRFRIFLGHFPKLKHLMIECSGEVRGFLADDYGYISSLPLKHDETQPKLETIAFPDSNYVPLTLRNQQNSLTKLSVLKMDIEDLSSCLRDLKKLKCLKIRILDYGIDDEEFIILPENDSIEILRIRFYFLKTDDLNQVIFKLPSLKELAVDTDIGEPIDIRFIASNMRHFERLLVSNDQEYTPDYREIQLNADQYINTSFVILNSWVNSVDYEFFEGFYFK